MANNVFLDGSKSPFASYQKDHDRRKVAPDKLESQLDQVFKKRREAPISQDVIDAVVRGTSHDLFSGFSPEEKV
ncbi:hypothetical protein [Simkania sp.]|uniref:hypothetical protein n=1 Tax=Simkania sp. TaxID=34094 RepID=UPI003B51BCC9